MTTQVQRTAEILGELVRELKKHPETAEPWANIPATAVVVDGWIPRLRRGSGFGPNDTIGIKEIPVLLGSFIIRYQNYGIADEIARVTTQIRNMVGDPAHR